jgi:hypothetical protein
MKTGSLNHRLRLNRGRIGPFAGCFGKNLRFCLFCHNFRSGSVFHPSGPGVFSMVGVTGIEWWRPFCVKAEFHARLAEFDCR